MLVPFFLLLFYVYTHTYIYLHSFLCKKQCNICIQIMSQPVGFSPSILVLDFQHQYLQSGYSATRKSVWWSLWLKNARWKSIEQKQMETLVQKIALLRNSCSQSFICLPPFRASLHFFPEKSFESTSEFTWGEKRPSNCLWATCRMCHAGWLLTATEVGAHLCCYTSQIPNTPASKLSLLRSLHV